MPGSATGSAPWGLPVHPRQRRRASIDPAGLLLGIVEVEGMAARVLRDAGVPPDDIRAALHQATS